VKRRRFRNPGRWTAEHISAFRVPPNWARPFPGTFSDGPGPGPTYSTPTLEPVLTDERGPQVSFPNGPDLEQMSKKSCCTYPFPRKSRPTAGARCILGFWAEGSVPGGVGEGTTSKLPRDPGSKPPHKNPPIHVRAKRQGVQSALCRFIVYPGLVSRDPWLDFQRLSIFPENGLFDSFFGGIRVGLRPN